MSEILRNKGIEQLICHGKLTDSEKKEQLEEFKTSNIPVMILSSKSIAPWMDLGAATSFIIEPGWNHGILDTILHRKADSSRQTDVYCLYYEDSVEETMKKILDEKKRLIESLLGI